MRHPFWIVNSSLLALLVISLGFVVFSRPQTPKPRKIKQQKTFIPSTKITPVNIEQIYNNDIFDTYHQIIAPAKEPSYVKPIPAPPQPSNVTIPEEPKQPFLPPLDVTLKGIMTVDDESMSVAIIADNKTKKDESYKVGDPIEDAQVIRILTNRIILIRSNGQQETLYLREKDVINDPAFAQHKDDWVHVAKQVSPDHYLLDHEAFVKIIPSLAHLIDIFDITTVYKEGKSIGCRIGVIPENSLGSALGLSSYMVIKKIGNLEITNTEERLKVYEQITNLSFGDSFSIELLDKNKEHTLNYRLHDLKDPFKIENTKEKEEKETGILQGPSEEELEKERIALLKEKYKFAPTTQELIIHQRKKMIQEGGQERLKDFSLSNEL
jgi:type II secretory pathway component PulC